MDAGEALEELTRLSADIDRAVIVDGGGAVVAATPGAAPARLARVAGELLEKAARVRPGAAVDRVEVSLESGSAFAVRANGLTAFATTGAEPTSALVVHDLRACLEQIDVPSPGETRRARGAADA